MAIKLQNHSFLSTSASNPCLSRNLIGKRVSFTKAAQLDYMLSCWGNSRKKCLTRRVKSRHDSHSLSYHLAVNKISRLTTRKARRMGPFFSFASADDAVSVNGSPQASTSSNVDEMRIKLSQSLQGEDDGYRLVQYLHDAARVFELSIKEQGYLSKLSWFSIAWVGLDRNAWVKTLSYQASVYCLLQAACDISSRGERRDRDVNMFVQKSLFRQSAPLETSIREKLSAKHPEACEWFWSEQVPSVVTSFVDYFEGDIRFSAATAVLDKGMPDSDNRSDIALLLLTLTCISAITKLGAARVSCPQFFSMISDITGRLMDMLVDFVPIRQAYHYIKDIGLRREFLVHFGPRVAVSKVKSDSSEEVIFWVNLIQEQLQRAIDREKIWSRLTTSESIEVLEKDLAIFGFFIALGRSTRAYLSANGFDDVDDHIEGLVRYLVGGSVLYYPQLSSISSYQLYVEVVCEELDWLPFYPGITGAAKQIHSHGKKREGPPNAEAIPEILDVCSYWMQSFIKYCKWLENPSNVKAARFLSRGHNKLVNCMEELGVSRNIKESSRKICTQRTGLESGSAKGKEMDSFDKALESVEEAVIRLEKLLQELHVSSSSSGKEQLKAACTDIEKIRKLKKEAEFLEASFRAKADSLKQGDDENSSQFSMKDQKLYFKGKQRKNANFRIDGSNSKSQGRWDFFSRFPSKKPRSETLVTDRKGDEYIDQTSSIESDTESKTNDILRFEQLRNELMELEKRVKRSTDRSANEEDTKDSDVNTTYYVDAGTSQLVQVQEKDDIIQKSIEKFKEASTDVLQGTQLLAIDVAAAMGLLSRSLIGDELTEKEKKSLKRTMTDLASVIPIGILMLLPVTAVGHAAMLAAIQRYVPSLIPSTYGPDRLELLRQLKKVKELETVDVDSNEIAESA